MADPESIGRILRDTEVNRRRILGMAKEYSTDTHLNSIDTLLKIEEEIGTIDTDKASKAWEYMLKLRQVNEQYEELQSEQRMTLVKDGVSLNKLLVQEYLLTQYVHNSLIKRVYKSTAEISAIPPDPERANDEERSEVQKYLSEIRQISGLETRLVKLKRQLGPIGTTVSFASESENTLLKGMIEKYSRYEK